MQAVWYAWFTLRADFLVSRALPTVLFGSRGCGSIEGGAHNLLNIFIALMTIYGVSNEFIKDGYRTRQVNAKARNIT